MLEIKNISKQFDQTKVLNTVSLKIKQGELFVLLGPSGCGKTTLLRLIGGIETPDSGEILLSGQRIDHKSPHQRSIHTVFQNYALFPHLNVWENIAFGPKVQKTPKDKINTIVAEALNTVRMGSFSKKMPDQLSGGQKQRVALARALVNRPQILLLDEPLSALDQKLRAEMQKELIALQRQLNITFIFVTHDQEEAMAMADRICIMNNGEVQQIGSGSELYQNPSNHFVAGFFGFSNSITTHLISVNETSVTLQLSSNDNLNLVLPLKIIKNEFKEKIINFDINCSNDNDNDNDKKIKNTEFNLLIRPENLTLTKVKRDNQTQLPVLIRKILFKGPTTEILCALNTEDNKFMIQVIIPSKDSIPLVEGEEAFLEPHSTVWLFPQEVKTL